MSEFHAFSIWLGAAFVLGIADELYRARRKRIGGSGEGTRRPQAALSIWGATPSVPSPEPPEVKP